MPKAADLMKRREEEVYNTLLSLSEKTRGFTDPELVVIGGYGGDDREHACTIHYLRSRC